MLFAGRVCSLLPLLACGHFNHLLNTPATLTLAFVLYCSPLLLPHLRRRPAVYRQKWSVGFQKSLSHSQISFLYWYNFSPSYSSKSGTTYTTSPFLINHRHCNRRLPCAHSPFTSIRNAWNTCANLFELFFPSRSCFNISIKSWILSNFFLLAFKQSSAQCSGVFSPHHTFLNLMELLLRYSGRTSLLQGFFLSILMSHGRRIGCRLRVPVSFDERNSQVRQNPIDFSDSFQLQIFFSGTWSWPHKCLRTIAHFICFLFLASSSLIQRD